MNSLGSLLRLRKEPSPQTPSNLNPRPPSSHEGVEFTLLPSGRPAEKSITRIALAQTFWPLVAHGLLNLGIAIFVIFYVDHHHFNVSNRRPDVRLHDDTMVPWVYFSPLQSDITTLLSVLMAVLRLIAAGWLGSLCWRCAFILMEIFGMKPGQLRNMITYGLILVPIRGIYKEGGRRIDSWLIWTILLISIPPQIAAPVLTGSITWVSGYHSPQRLSKVDIPTPLVGEADQPPGWSGPSALHWEWIAKYAATRTFLSWGRDPKNDALKRFVPELSTLEVGNIVANITLPYFVVHSIEWVDDPQSALSASSIRDSRDACSRITVAGPDCPFGSLGALALIPDTPLSNQTELKSSKISERRLMWQYVAMSDSNSTSCTRKWNSTKVESYELSPNYGIYQDGIECYRFAWVTYTAGVGACRNCRISSYATVQNHTALEPMEDFVTDEALRPMPTVVNLMLDSSQMGHMVPVWKSLDEVVVGMLSRSYSASWMALTDYLVSGTPGSTPYNATYLVSPPASQALVNLPRVYIWLGLQSLITLSGILLVVVQSRTGTSAVIDARLAAFYLDSSAVSELDEPYSVARQVEFEGDLLRIKAV